ncbi:MAG: radical SAM protein, partial [Hyphomicrobiales bacterium]|nr:radical SAM protein [Hyphomicrobiales bacterium]
MSDTLKRRRFLLFLVKPSHYDDDGYVIQWMKSALPSNSLACLYGIAKEAMENAALGEDVDIEIFPVDETNTRVRPDRIARQMRDAGGFGLVGFAGVQSNQFPRVMDCARPLRAAGIPVCIGGFHVSGCLAMLKETPDSLKEALDLGISLFAGEAEGRFADVLRDCAAGRLQPIYNYLDDLPGLEGAAHPILPRQKVGRSIGMISSFDGGRGCPFLCSFCTIINVQGRKSRYRTADDIEAIVRSNHKNGVRYFFITDDNLARNRNWEAIFDRLIQLRQEGLNSRFVIQVDTACHKIPRFIEKEAAAGVKRVFIGLENIDPDNLAAAKKKQNHIADYRELLLEWRKHRCITYCGYIIGFPGDTPESVVRRIEIIKRELPVDILQYSCLTPLPGCEDHAKAVAAGVDIDADLNKFDLEHVVTDHPRMTRAEWQELYHTAFRTYYT